MNTKITVKIKKPKKCITIHIELLEVITVQKKV